MKAKKTIRLTVVAAIIAAMTSCGSTPTKEGPEAIRQKIADYRGEISELNQKIQDLEDQLSKMGEEGTTTVATRVGVVVMEPSTFDQFFVTSATLEAVQSAFISPETSGQIQQVTVTKGQRVNAGQVVARLNTSVILSSIDEVKTGLDLAKTVYQRQAGLWAQQIGSEIQYLEAKNRVETLETRLKTLQSQLNMAIVRAPFAGIIDDIFLKEGEVVMPGVRFMNIVNLQKLYVNAQISESYVGNIKKGQMVTVRFPAYPDLVMELPVNRVSSVINPENRTFGVQLLLSNNGDRFKPNMMATLSIKTFTKPDALVVQSVLLKQDTKGAYIYIAQKNGNGYKASKVYISRGADGQGVTMIDNGLEPGTLVITEGHNQVTNGMSLEIMNKN